MVDYLNGYFFKIYGRDEFPTTSYELDILKFKQPSHYYNNLMIRDID